MNWNDQKDNRYIFTVSELNNSAKKTLENSFSDIWIKGEISNFKSYPSGHWYFTLKDEESQIQCVMFKFKNSSLNFIPKEGDEFIALGSASMYLARGNYQFQVESLEKDGIGKLYEEYEKLKTRLNNQGLFDESNKLEIPSYPQKIALITSEKGAVLQDIKNVLNRRAPSIEVNLFSSLVQGQEAEQSILHNLNLIKEIQPQYKYDLLVFARGGGSIEDLWVFNSEKIAIPYAIIPIIITTILLIATGFPLNLFLNRDLYKRSSVTAEEDTKSCESAVDIIAETAPEIKRPAITGCIKYFVKIGIAFSASTVKKNDGPKCRRATNPTKNAPMIAGKAHAIAILLASLISFELFIAINLIKR